jgi:hypothetical protein
MSKINDSSTQAHLPIEDIRDDLVFLKDGSVAQILETTAVNFGLLFETEQIGIIDSFAGMLNSLSFPIQIVIRSKRLDVSSYLHTLDRAMQSQSNSLLHTMTAHYRQFVESLIKENEVLDKQFYIGILAGSAEFGVLPSGSEEKTQKAQTLLKPRVDHILRQLARIGLKARALTSVELIKLYYDIYNDSVNAIPLNVAVNQMKQPSPPVVTLPQPTNAPPAHQNTATAVPSVLYAPTPTQLPPTPQPLPPQISQQPAAVQQSNGHMPFVVEELPDEASA